MNIAVTTPQYVDSVSCFIIDGLLQLGHKVFNLQGPAINYAECWPIPSPSKIDLWFMLDTDNRLALTLTPDKMGGPLRSAKKAIIHGHDRFVDYINAPDSPIKPVPVGLFKCDVAFVRDLDQITLGQLNDQGLPGYPIDYTIESRYIEACAPHLEGKRKLAIAFYGTLDTARRKQYLEAIKQHGIPVSFGTYDFNEADGKWSKWIHGRYTHDPRYYEELCNYMFIFCPMGAGWSCFRHAETYAAGCIPVIQKPANDIIPYHTYEDGVNCILWETEKELIEKLNHWRNNGDVHQLRERCYEHGQKYMTSKILAQYMLDAVEKIK
jgi:hypothetical protein